MVRLFSRFCVFALFLTATFGIAAAADDPPTLAGTAIAFATVPWGSTPDTIKTTLAQRGFQYAQTDDEGDLVFTGKNGPLIVTVFEVLDPSHRLVKTLITVNPPASDVIDVFRSLSQAFTQKIGAPSAAYEDYHGADNDRDKRASITAGTATLASFWMYKDGSSIYVNVTKSLMIETAYESPQWSAEAARRKAAAPSSS